MIGLKLKRGLVDLLYAERDNPASGLYQIQVGYTQPPHLEDKSVWLGDGVGPGRPGVAEGVVEVDSAIVPVVVRVAGELGTERATDAAAEALADVIAAVVRMNPTLAGVNTRTAVTGRGWSNPSDDDDAVTELTVEVTGEGYA